MSGEGHISYVAQNGIQFSYGATGIVTGNKVSDNYYTPKSWTACGLLFFEAAGVKQSSNTFSGNEINICNAGRGGGNPRLNGRTKHSNGRGRSADQALLPCRRAKVGGV